MILGMSVAIVRGRNSRGNMRQGQSTTGGIMTAFHPINYKKQNSGPNDFGGNMSSSNVDNPIICGGDGYEIPAMICSNCNESWYQEAEHPDLVFYESARKSGWRQPISKSGRYCVECVIDQSTAELEEEWRRENVSDEDFLCYMLRGREDCSFDEDMASRVFEAFRNVETDAYTECLGNYIRDNADQYIEWLLEKR